jgi:hypothetical protein
MWQIKGKGQQSKPRQQQEQKMEQTKSPENKDQRQGDFKERFCMHKLH